MKFSCNQRDLTEGLNSVQKAVSVKTTLPILKGILIETDGEFIKLTGNDLNLGIEARIPATIMEHGSVVVSSRIFGEIIRKLPETQLNFNVDESHQVSIDCQHSSFNLLGQSGVEFPELPQVEDSDSFTLSQELFRSMIRQTIFATSQDEARPILTGVLVEANNGEMSMVAIDGYRLALRKAAIDPSINKRAVIPGKTLSELSRLMTGDSDEVLKISMTDRHILFEVNAIKIVSRLLEGEFIKYGQIIPKEKKSVVITNVMELTNAIERASLMAREGKNSSIRFSIKDDIMTIRSNVEIGSVREDLSISLEGEDIEIGFNPRYMLDALKILETEDVILEMTTPVSPCIMKPVGSDTYLYLVLPVRMPNS